MNWKFLKERIFVAKIVINENWYCIEIRAIDAEAKKKKGEGIDFLTEFMNEWMIKELLLTDKFIHCNGDGVE